MWCPPLISLKWGEYFAPDADDDAKEVAAAIDAHGEGLITRRCAVEKIQRVFKIENVDQFIDALEEEDADKAAKQQERMANGEMMMQAVLGDSAKPAKPTPPTVPTKPTKPTKGAA